MKQSPLIAVLFSVFLLGGCGTYYKPLQLEPIKTANPIAPRFTQSVYYFDRDRNLYFILRTDEADQATGKPLTQIATIRVFWHPKGGVTTLNPAALNATFRYIVMTPDAVGMYEGAGFVRLDSKDGVSKFAAHVIDGDMRLTQASTSFSDTLGRSHIRGHFTAVYDDARAVDMLLAAHREFFARSLLSKPATAPAPTAAPAGSAEEWAPPATIPATVPAAP